MRLFRLPKDCLAESTKATASAPFRPIGIGAWSTIINVTHLACLRGSCGTLVSYLAGIILRRSSCLTLRVVARHCTPSQSSAMMASQSPWMMMMMAPPGLGPISAESKRPTTGIDGGGCGLSNEPEFATNAKE